MKNKRAAVLAFLLLAACTPPDAPLSAESSAKLSPYIESVGGTSALDFCGDAKTGRTYRDAMVEKINRGMFTPAEKLHFSAFVANENSGIEKEIAQYIAQHGSLPDKLPGQRITCEEVVSEPGVIFMRKRLALYKSGRMSLNEALQDHSEQRQ